MNCAICGKPVPARKPVLAIIRQHGIVSAHETVMPNGHEECDVELKKRGEHVGAAGKVKP